MKTANKEQARQADAIEITPAMIEAGVKFVMNEFYPAEWGGVRGIQEIEARLLIEGVLEAALSGPQNTHR